MNDVVFIGATGGLAAELRGGSSGALFVVGSVVSPVGEDGMPLPFPPLVVARSFAMSRRASENSV